MSCVEVKGIQEERVTPTLTPIMSTSTLDVNVMQARLFT